MSEKGRATLPSRSKFWRRMEAGDRAGRPLAEWAYLSPQTPHGITVTDLREAPLAIQHQVAVTWFHSNFKPFELGEGPFFGFAEAAPQGGLNTNTLNTAPLNSVPHSDGSRFSDGSGYAQSSPPIRVAGFDHGFFRPEGVTAEVVLTGEFGGVLDDRVILPLAEHLAGEWMPLRPDLQPIYDLQATALSGAELQSALLERLAVLSTQVAMLTAEHGGLGHNSAAADLPFGPDERAMVERTIAQARAFDDGALPLGETNAREVGHSLNSLSTKLGHWLLKLTDIYATEAAKSLGKATGVAVAVGLAALANIHEIQTLWSGLVRLLTGH